MLSRLLACSAVAVCGLNVQNAHVWAEDAAPPVPVTHTWPQWRGPTRDSLVTAGPKWPDKLAGEALTQLWRVELDRGYPGPIVSADRVFVAETAGREREVVRALDRKTGKEIWRAEWKGSLTVPFFALRNGSWIRSTPAFDGESLYVAGIRDVLVCLNAADGKERWRVDFVEKYKTPLPAFGYVSSPLIDGDALYVQAGAAVCKLDKRTGEVLWRKLESRDPMMGSAFSSPVVATIAGRKQVVFQTREKLAGLDPETGEVLWERSVPAFRGMNILTPTVFKDQIFTSTYQNRSYLYTVSGSPDAKDKFAVAEAWNNKVQGYMSSPVLIDGHVYLHLQNRRVACIELATGKEKWITSERFGEYWSMVAQGDKILALDQDGTLYLMRANPEKFELLDSRKIAGKAETWGHLAVAGDEIFVRELEAIVAYRWK
jgi:outer membrane protein assembly factor BamB